MEQVHGENWREEAEDDPVLWFKSSGGNKHGHHYLIDSIVDTAELKRSLSSRPSSQMPTGSSASDRLLTQAEFDERLNTEMAAVRKEQQKERHETQQKFNEMRAMLNILASQLGHGASMMMATRTERTQAPNQETEAEHECEVAASVHLDE